MFAGGDSSGRNISGFLSRKTCRIAQHGGGCVCCEFLRRRGSSAPAACSGGWGVHRRSEQGGAHGKQPGIHGLLPAQRALRGIRADTRRPHWPRVRLDAPLISGQPPYGLGHRCAVPFAPRARATLNDLRTAFEDHFTNPRRGKARETAKEEGSGRKKATLDIGARCGTQAVVRVCCAFRLTLSAIRIPAQHR